ncbi:hypothetical protein VHEMI04415 [[Torrubiella] hemipterigena]|uniref:Uncharacterized protein n=1 Tax=[Torrubiella] hemipterigena TaxID=1531966 RepID=A0A0A1T161_9HYPO|nr:hypothetical protein VHEMI04415 [[Torrubiella] hemipterigena]
MLRFTGSSRDALKLILLYAAVDAVVGSAAAAAIIALASHIECKPASSSMYSMGIVAAVSRAVLLGFSAMPLLNLPRAYLYAFVHIATKFVFATASTAIICSITIGTVSSKIVGAAALATVPWLAEDHTVYMYARTHQTGGFIEYSFQRPLSLCPGFEILWMAAWDALTGYVFGQAAKSFGVGFSSLGTVAAAGATFGAIMGIPASIFTFIINVVNNEREHHGFLVEQCYSYDTGGELPKPSISAGTPHETPEKPAVHACTQHTQTAEHPV